MCPTNFKHFFLAGASSLLLLSCQKGLKDADAQNAQKSLGQDKINLNNDKVNFSATSVTPSFVKMMANFETVGIYPMITGDDVLPQSPDFVYGAQPDGQGFLKNPNGDGYIMLNNHEILRSVSRVYLDKNLKPVKGEYIVNAEGGMWRLCSATMATPQEHGFGPVFLTAGESGADSRVHAIDPFGSVSDRAKTDRVLPALGRASMENAVPLPKDAFRGKTVIIIGEDDSNGQVVLYVSDTPGDLQNGKLYFLRRSNADAIETNMAVGGTYDVEFVEIDNARSATGAEVAAQSVAKKAVQFARVEDLDYRKGGGANSRELYFVSTGVANTTGKTMWGRLYQLKLDENDPLKGQLTVIRDGSINPGNDMINPDNVTATENYVYVLEDGDSFYPAAKHDSWIWQYNIKTGEFKPFLTMDHRRNDPLFNSAAVNGGYNQSGQNHRFGSWEFGAMTDISRETKVEGTFLLNIHPHTWRKSRFLNADGTNITNNNEGGQTVILTGVPR
jgi:hypothetical protein